MLHWLKNAAWVGGAPQPNGPFDVSWSYWSSELEHYSQYAWPIWVQYTRHDYKCPGNSKCSLSWAWGGGCYYSATLQGRTIISDCISCSRANWVYWANLQWEKSEALIIISITLLLKENYMMLCSFIIQVHRHCRPWQFLHNLWVQPM